MKSKQIVYETKDFYVSQKTDIFEIYHIGLTCSRRCAVIGHPGKIGLDRAMAECDRRQASIDGK